MTDSTLNPLNFLLPTGPDNRFLFRLVETCGLVSAALIPAFIVYTQLAGRFPSEVQYGTVLYLGLVAVFVCDLRLRMRTVVGQCWIWP